MTMELLKDIFSPSGFEPHGYCLLWNPWLVWLHVVSDTLIFISYTSIPFTLVYFMRRRRDLPFNWMFGGFAAFIISCGLTHALDIWTLWHASYWLSGAVKAVTALVSLPTAIMLMQLVPRALAIPSQETLKNEIAERKRAEEEILKLNRILQARAAELQAVNKDLEAFTYSVAHDLRAPLRRTDGFAQLLLEEYNAGLPDEAQHYLHRMREGTRQMGQLVDDLLNLARIERKEVTLQVTGLSSLVEEVRAELKRETDGRAIAWKISPLPFVECDPALMKVVFTNLLSNAVKYTRPRQQARIEVGTIEQDGRSVLFVRDNGVGFSMKYADKLFGVFQRLHRVEDFEGTGVGLATAQRIVHKHGGQIWAEAELDKGACFYFTLGTQPQTEPETRFGSGKESDAAGQDRNSFS